MSSKKMPYIVGWIVAPGLARLMSRVCAAALSESAVAAQRKIDRLAFIFNMYVFLSLRYEK